MTVLWYSEEDNESRILPENSVERQGDDMKKNKNPEGGISLRIVYVCIIIAAVIMMAIMIYATIHLTSSFLQLSSATEEHIDLERAANSMLNASDYLTEKAQRFTGNGNMQFLEEYFTEAKETSRREKALDKMDDKPEFEKAYQHLKDAVDYSLKLMNQEYYAMKLVIEAKGYLYYPDGLQAIELSQADSALPSEDKMRKATQLLLSNDYYNLKDKIRSSMKQCLKEIEAITMNEEGASKETLSRALKMVRILFLVQTVLFLLVLLLTSVLGINPVLKAKKRIKNGDPLNVNGAKEFRYLAHSYNNLYEANKKTAENPPPEHEDDDPNGG